MSFKPIDLPWLADPPSDFRTQCRELDQSTPDLGAVVQRLATFRLDLSQAGMLSRAIRRCRAAGANFEPLSPFKLGVVSGATFDFVAEVLPAAAARHGIVLDVRLAPLDQIEQQAFDPASEINTAELDGVLLAVDHRWLGLDRAALAGDEEARHETAVARLRDTVRAFALHSKATPIVSSVAVPPLSLFGSYDRRAAGSVRRMVERLNSALPDLCADAGAALLDVGAIAEIVGTAAWFDAASYNLYKLPFASDAVPLYADWVGRLLGAMRGKARKCLVLDLDNTCWGGVIGDDGLEGIRIGNGSPEGEAFLAVQQAALALKARGVVLAVSSKNDDVRARSPFREHPDMLLRETDFAVFQANWEDKPSNLEAIARKLEIGLDALVFLDDNAAERAQVRAALPVVAVPELPADAALYPAMLFGAGYFESIAFSDEDRRRTDSYAANAERAQVMSLMRDLGDYLDALQMRISHAQFDGLNRSRIAQLINKSNQFNLTTRRYTEAQVAELETSAAFTLQTRLADRFGDFGMIGVVVAREQDQPGPPVWHVDTWLMSCRVLGRKVEDAMLNELVSAARAAGVTALTAEYIPTAKNEMVSRHFDKLGFALVEESPAGVRSYRLETATFEPRQTPFAPL